MLLDGRSKPDGDPRESGRRAFGRDYRREALHEFFHGLPVLVVLMVVSLILELKHLDPFGEEAFARWVATRQDPDVVESIAEPFALDLQISAAAGVRRLEVADEPATPGALTTPLSDGVLERTEGVRPFDRTKLGTLLRGLAKNLAGRSIDVIVIDLDLAPIEKAGEANPNPEVQKALEALRRIATVVVAAVERPVPWDFDRSQFIDNVRCSPGSQALFETVDGLKPLYFASPLVFHQLHSEPFRFPGAATHPRRGGSGSDGPDWFPSLGVAMFLAARSLHGAAADKAADAREGLDDVDARRALSYLCDQSGRRVRVADGNALRLGFDPTADAEAKPHLKDYRARLYDWQTQDPPAIERTVLDVDHVKALQEQRSIGLDLRNAAIVVVSAAGPGSTDRYSVPFFPGRPDLRASGALLHTMAARSLRHPVHESASMAVAVDGLIGSLFLAVGSFVIPGLRRLRRRLPVAGLSLFALFPLAMAGLLLFVAIEVVAYALTNRQWVNPIYMIFGLALHVYLVGWEEVGAGSHPHGRWWDPLTFGIPRFKAAWRGGTPSDADQPTGRRWPDWFDATIAVSLWAVPLAILVCLLIIPH